MTETVDHAGASRSRGGRFLLLIAACVALTAGLAIVGGAGRVPAETTTPSAPIAAATPILSAVPSAANWLTPEQIARAVAFRESAGIRSDEAWIRVVAVDPAAQPGVVSYSIPLLPSELEALDARATTTTEILRAIAPYAAAHSDSWAGDYTDQVRGVVVVRFTKDVATHSAAIHALIRPGAPIEIEPATNTLAALQALTDRVGVDTDWLRSHGFDIWGVGADVVTNNLLVQVSTKVADPDAVLEAHYAASGMLEVESDGTGVRLLPTGTLKGHVTDDQGDLITGIEVILVGDIAGAGPTGDVGHETSSSGAFVFKDLTAVGYEIQLYRDTNSGRVMVGHVHVMVRPGKVTDVVVEANG